MKNIVLFFSLSSMLCAQEFPTNWQQEFHLDWSAIDLDNSFWKQLDNTLARNFALGAATAALQTEGTKTDTGFAQNSFTYNNPERQYDISCDHWDRYIEDVALMKKLGINEYRFEVPWWKIEPQEGVFDEAVLAHYIDLCKRLVHEGINPVVCFFHFKLPVWFYLQGGFEKEENVSKFEAFCNYVFKVLQPYVKKWVTYNEPIAYVIEAYHAGHFPPYQKGMKGLYKAGVVLKNMLNAHVELYEQLKKSDPTSQIGFVKMFHILDAHSHTQLERFIVRMANHIVYDSLFNFFKTGTFNWLWLIRDYNPKAPQSLDYIGVNYYTHEIIHQNGLFGHKRDKSREDEETTNSTGWSIYPEGLYRSLLKAQELNVPIYVTENGINDPDNSQRADFIKKHLYMIQCAQQNGINVYGYTYWCLMDKYGFGLYAIDPITKNRSLQKSAAEFVTFMCSRQNKKRGL